MNRHAKGTTLVATGGRHPKRHGQLPAAPTDLRLKVNHHGARADPQAPSRKLHLGAALADLLKQREGGHQASSPAPSMSKSISSSSGAFTPTGSPQSRLADALAAEIVRVASSLGSAVPSGGLAL